MSEYEFPDDKVPQTGSGFHVEPNRVIRCDKCFEEVDGQDDVDREGCFRALAKAKSE